METLDAVLEQVERLAQLMAQHNATHLEWREGALRIALSRPKGAESPSSSEEGMPPLFVSGYASAEGSSSASEPSAWQPPAPLAVCSEYVGYCTPASIAVGSTVERGQVLATVTVLGIPNEVVAPLPGVLEAWAVEAGQPVQYGQVIAYLRPLSEE
ncbi:MAG: biotin/lipoyl-binding protein [Fimbriimonadales bacterium]|nr:biotin/lipoyl-binding protein [Fimbriimonadales bacterium]MDW8051367.1 biotin/lipoyl-binding protein [Armatimonadota bacterium]